MPDPNPACYPIRAARNTSGPSCSIPRAWAILRRVALAPCFLANPIRLPFLRCTAVLCAMRIELVTPHTINAATAIITKKRRVLHNGQDGRWITVSAWMPDGRQILATSYNLKEETNQRQIISLSDSIIHDIGQPEKAGLDWGYPSPDGRYIAFGLKEDIYIYDTAKGQDSVLVQSPMADNVIGWTAEGS